MINADIQYTIYGSTYKSNKKKDVIICTAQCVTTIMEIL